MTDERMPPPDADPDAPSPDEHPSTGAEAASEAERPEGTDGLEGMPEAAASAPPTPLPPKVEPPNPLPPKVEPPRVEPASPDIDIVAASSMLPGSHRGGFFRLPTAPIAVTVQSAPTEPDGDLTPASAQWLASDEPQIHKGLAGWALAFAIIGLVVSLFVGWGFPIGLVAVVSAVFALRRPLESRAMAVWAIVIGAVSILYSAGWLLYAAMRANLIG